MYFNIFIIYHGDIYRKQLIHNLISKLFYKPNIEYIFSNNNQSINNISNSVNDLITIYNHNYIWNKIASSKIYNDIINIIIDDTVNINNKSLSIYDILKWFDNIFDDLYNSTICKNWNIVYLYDKSHNINYNEIHATNNLLIPSNQRILYKSYIITYQSAKLLTSCKLDNITNLNTFFINLQYNNTLINTNCWIAFITAKPIFIEDDKNEDITKYIKSYNIIKNSYRTDLQIFNKNTITKYFTIICFVDKYYQYNHFKRIHAYINSLGIHIIPIFYEQKDTNLVRAKYLLDVINTIVSIDKDNHYLMITNSIYIIININLQGLMELYHRFDYDIIYLHNNITINKYNIIESLWTNNISITKYSYLYNIINDNIEINLDNIIYSNQYNDDLFLDIHSKNKLSLKMDNNIGNFYYKENNERIYPLFIYSLKYDIIVDDLLNLYPHRGCIINTINEHVDNKRENNKCLIVIYINNIIYSKIENSSFNQWINIYKSRLITPLEISEIDIILYTDDINIYDTISQFNNTKIEYIKNISDFFITMIQYAEYTYKYILWTTGYHELTHIYTLYDLISINQSIVAPLISGYKNNKKSLSVLGTINRIIDRTELGIWVVPYIRDTFLIRSNIYSELVISMMKNKINNNETINDYIIRCIKYYNIPLWLTNIRQYGVDIRI